MKRLKVKQGESNENRNSAIELLRTISMVMIVFHHFAVHGGFEWSTTLDASCLWYYVILMGGKIGVNVFILISGYFLIKDQKPLNVKKILKFWGQVFFYSVVIYAILCLTGVGNFDYIPFIKSILPITFDEWWFASSYFVLYLLHPILNKLLCKLNKKQYIELLMLLIICWSIIPTLTGQSFQGNSLLWFITLYAIAGYIQLHGFKKKIMTKKYLITFIISAVFTYTTAITFTILGTKWEFLAESPTYFYSQEKITTLVTSVSLFMVFATVKMSYHKWINIIASTTFGIYLIHDHPVIRYWLWQGIIQSAQFQGSLKLIPYSIFAVVSVFAICAFIDWIRQKTIEKPYLVLVNKYSDKITIFCTKVTNCIKKVL